MARGTAVDGVGEPGEDRGWSLIRRSLRAHRRGVVLGVSVGLIWTVAKVSVPFLVGEAIDRGIEAEDGAAVLRW